MLKRYNHAYSLAEIMIALTVMTLLIGLITSRVLRQSPDIEKTRLKKAYITIEQTISSMINNDVLYPGENMLRNLEPVTTSVGDEFGVDDPNSKFRDSFMYYLTVVEEDMTCDVYTGNEAFSEADTCFKTSDGVVYGIPDTDVNLFGVIPYRSERPGAREHQYVPITVYPNFDTKKDVNTDTMLIGVRFDGKIQIFARDENCAENDLSIRCNVLNHLHSDNIKKDRN